MLALGLAMRKDQFLSNTKIPLIIHQTWKNFDSSTWSDIVRLSVNEWLEAAVGGPTPETPPTAYIMWDDQGVEEFMKVYENSSWSAIDMMPYKVERADVFRVAVLKWFGGVVSELGPGSCVCHSIDTMIVRRCRHQATQASLAMDPERRYPPLGRPRVQSPTHPTRTEREEQPDSRGLDASTFKNSRCVG
jgi:hypothetical protein